MKLQLQLSQPSQQLYLYFVINLNYIFLNSLKYNLCNYQNKLLPVNFVFVQMVKPAIEQHRPLVVMYSNG